MPPTPELELQQTADEYERRFAGRMQAKVRASQFGQSTNDATTPMGLPFFPVEGSRCRDVSTHDATTPMGLPMGEAD